MRGRAGTGRRLEVEGSPYMWDPCVRDRKGEADGGWAAVGLNGKKIEVGLLSLSCFFFPYLFQIFSKWSLNLIFRTHFESKF